MKMSRPRQEALRYLRDQAIMAHLDGQGGKARHLAAVALRREAQRAMVPVAEFKELAWAFVLLIYWMLEEHDFAVVLDGAWEAFGKGQKRQNGPIAEAPKDHWCTLVRFLMGVLRPNEPKWKNDLAGMERIPKEFFEQTMDQWEQEALSLLLCLAIEFSHLLYPDQEKDASNVPWWNFLSKTWEDYTSEKKDLYLVCRRLKETRLRLEKQHGIILDPTQFSHEPENAVESFWRAFYELNTVEMTQTLSDLVALSTRDPDMFYPVQSLINMTRLMLGLFEDQFFGVYRIQRLYLENPRWLFHRLRRLTFEEILTDAQNKAKRGAAIGSESAHLWRLSLLRKSHGLRHWDLSGYLSALQSQSRAEIFWGFFPVDFGDKPKNQSDERFLADGIISAVRGCNFQSIGTPEFDEIRRAILHLEVHQEGKTQIKLLIKELTKVVRPIEIHGILNAFSVLSDALPENHLNEVFEISIHAWKRREIGHDTKKLNWWEDVFRWCNMTAAQWSTVGALLTDFFGQPALWRSSVSMLTKALEKAPEKLVGNWCQLMVDLADDGEAVSHGMPIIFNAALRRKPLKSFALAFLDKMRVKAKETERIDYNHTLLEVEGSIEQLLTRRLITRL